MKDLVKLVNWSKIWQMIFYMEKGKITQVDYINHGAEYRIDEGVLQTIREELDLEVIMQVNTGQSEKVVSL